LFSTEIDKAVADPTFREDILGLGRIEFEFLAKVIDIQSQIMSFVSILVSPDLSEQLFVWNNPSGILNKMVKKSVLSWPQFYELILDPHLAAVKIDLQSWIDLDDFVGEAAGHLCASQDRTDSTDEFAWTEGFGDVIVCP
jgi:hypothetical protein